MLFLSMNYGALLICVLRIDPGLFTPQLITGARVVVEIRPESLAMYSYEMRILKFQCMMHYSCSDEYNPQNTEPHHRHLKKKVHSSLCDLLSIDHEVYTKWMLLTWSSPTIRMTVGFQVFRDHIAVLRIMPRLLAPKTATSLLVVTLY